MFRFKTILCVQFVEVMRTFLLGHYSGKSDQKRWFGIDMGMLLRLFFSFGVSFLYLDLNLWK